MPAPVPIQVQYGDIGLAAALALASGRQQYANQNRQRQQAFDQNFLSQEFDRRAAWDRARLGQSDSPLMNLAARQASQDQAMQLQSALQRRREATPTAATAVVAPVAASIGQRLPSRAPSGMISGPGGTATVNEQGVQIQRQTPYHVSGGPGVMDNSQQMLVPPSMPRVGGFSMGTPAPVQTPDTVQAQLDYLAALQGTMQPEQLAALRVAAQSGQLKMSQLINESQQMASKPQGMTQRDIELQIVRERASAQSELDRLRRAYAELDDYSDPDGTGRLQIAQFGNQVIDRMRALDKMTFAPTQSHSIVTNTNPQPVQGVDTPGARLQAGHVEDGYRFRGGDPADPRNWEAY